MLRRVLFKLNSCYNKYVVNIINIHIRLIIPGKYASLIPVILEFLRQSVFGEPESKYDIIFYKRKGSKKWKIK